VASVLAASSLAVALVVVAPGASSVVALDAFVRASVGQIAVLDATPGDAVAVRSGATVVATTTVDANGSALVRQLAEGAAYSVTVGSRPAQTIATLTAAPPDPVLYGQTVGPGYGYITTRDGTMLSVNVTLPGPPENGPYPTVVEYSGYDPSNPTVTVQELLGIDGTGECPFYVEVIAGNLCTPPAQPSSAIAAGLGYAVVSVNVRGTGCSGGAFDLFERLQALDGYDVIETVARQPWVLHNRVGMVGLSYPGIMQLYVAAEQPPSLSAIAPQSVIGDTYRGLAFPGGIFNPGFVGEWVTRVFDRAGALGQGWEQTVIDRELAATGTSQCALNQRLRLQNRNVLVEARDVAIDDPRYAYLSPRNLYDRITVPVFLTGQWQDEQTGGYFANDLGRFTNAPVVRAIVSNGMHPDGYGAPWLSKWLQFLELYVAERSPQLPANAWVFTPLVSQQIFGSIQTPNGALFDTGASFEEARAAYEAEPRVEVWFESGTGVFLQPGAPSAGYKTFFDSWPPPATATTWYLRSGGSLSPFKALFGGGSSSYSPSLSEPSTTTYVGADEGLWAANADLVWPRPAAGAGLSFTTGVFWGATTFAGSASADLWVASNTTDTDLEVTLSEVRLDGSEVYIQSGWLRASRRALDTSASTALRPVHLHTGAQALTPDTPTLMRVEILPFAHTIRAGSKLRFTIDAPGASRARWTFDSINAPGTTNTVHHSSSRASKIVLPVVNGVTPTLFGPGCNALRAQPCRD
jgi:uncharacterized protein